MNFLERAQFTAAKNVRVIRLGVKSKAAIDSGWPTLATTDFSVLSQWNAETPDANCGAVADGSPDGVWFLELDSRDVLDRIARETGHDLISEVPTYLIRSREGRGHVYLRNTPAALEMGNLAQGHVKYGDFSARVKNAYVVAAHSIHPHSNEPYTPINNNEILPAPQWLIDWLIAQKVEKTPSKDGDYPRNERNLIQHGYVHSFLVQNCGRLRGMGLGGDLLENALLEIAHLSCAPPLDDNKIRQVARSFEKYEPNPVADIILNQKPEVQNIAVPIDELELPTFDSSEYPVFPRYVFSNTSIYKNFVEPICKVNSRIDYFMWLPAMALLLNYLGTKVKFKNNFTSSFANTSIYMLLIGKRGETNKSTSVDDAMEYFRYMGCLAHGGKDKAEGRSLVWTPGSLEGLGNEAQKTSAKNLVIYYDELSQLSKKAGIDNSSLSSGLLTLYESKKFSNAVKSGKEAYSLDPSSYVATLLTCCTDESFQDLWSKMNGSDTGLNDRMFFVFQPEELPARSIFMNVNTMLGSLETRRLIDKAVMKGEYEIENYNNPKLQQLVALGNRYVDRAIKWALAIAVDLGLDIVDDEAIDRGVDIVKYEIQVKQYLKSYDAHSREAALQMRIRSKLEMHKGKLLKRELERLCHASREGTTAWGQSYYGLIKTGIICEIGQGTKGDPKYVQVLQKLDTEEL